MYYLGVSGDANRNYDPAGRRQRDSNGATGSYRLLVHRSREGWSQLSRITTVADSGTPAAASVASANIGQTITLEGTGLRSDDQVVFTRIDSAGRLGTTTVNPTSVATDGLSLQVVVPTDATSGQVRLTRELGGIFLQVVPTLADIDQGNGDRYHSGSLLLRGTGFAEAGTTISFGGQTLIDEQHRWQPAGRASRLRP